MSKELHSIRKALWGMFWVHLAALVLLAELIYLILS